mmetsp:Transcript_38276/g.108203  ORF Transcript_38276/g.108203 Transcript_38276/m.108203 type:complete len:154 (-) Transcript_38276:47-508(-)
MFKATRKATLLTGQRPVGHRRQTRDSSNGKVSLLAVSIIGSLLLVGVIYWRLPGDLDSSNTNQVGQPQDSLWTSLEGQQLLNTPSEAFCRRRSAPHVCAHGGDPESGYSNTLRAFQAATSAGYQCVEVDLVLSADGKLVVLHVRLKWSSHAKP